MRSLRLILLTLLLAARAISARAEEGPHWLDKDHLEDAKRQAAATNRLVLIHFWAPWCGPCMRLESTVFSKPSVAQAMESCYVPVKVNAQDFPATCRQFGVERLPTDVIVSPTGRVLQRLQCPPDSLLYTTQLLQTANAIAGASPRPTANSQVAAAPTVPVNPPADSPFRNAAVAMNAPPAMQPPFQSAFQPAVAANGAAPTPGPNMSSGPMPGPRQSMGAIDPSATVVSPVGAVGPFVNNSPAIAESATSGPNSSTNFGAAAGDQGSASMTVNNNRPPIFSGVPVNPTRVNPIRASTAPAAPASAPRYGLDGYCPVTLIERSMIAKNDPHSWVRGDVRWGAVHRGVTYLFAGPEEQKRFLATPDRYAPVLSGNDVVIAFDNGRLEPGRREFGMFSNGRIYLFASAETLAKFVDKPNTDRYIDSAWRVENPQPAPAMR